MSLNNNKQSFADKLGIPTTNISVCIPEVMRILKTGKVPCLHGEAGIGKTASMSQLAKMLNKPIYTFICSHMSETDMGIPFRGEGNVKYFDMLPPEQVYNAITSKEGAVLFFDEITRADKATLNAIFAVISERKVGNVELNSNIDIVCACNPDDGEYSVNDIISDPAWRRRLVHMWLETDALSWSRYARDKGLNKHVVEYIESKPDCLIGYEARAAGKVYANPAAWESVAKYLDVNSNHLSTIALSGMIGFDTSRDLVSFIINTEYRVNTVDLIKSFDTQKATIDKIISDGRGDILNELVRSVAIAISLHKVMPDIAASSIVKFWDCLPEESAVLFNNELERQNRGESATYFGNLYSELQKQKSWSKIVQKIKNITRVGKN
jgi:hypothetical protein